MQEEETKENKNDGAPKPLNQYPKAGAKPIGSTNSTNDNPEAWQIQETGDHHEQRHSLLSPPLCKTQSKIRGLFESH